MPALNRKACGTGDLTLSAIYPLLPQDGNEPAWRDIAMPVDQSGAAVLRADGHGVPALLDAILSVIPLDAYVEHPVLLMETMDCDKDLEIPIWDEYKSIIASHDARGAEAVGHVERFAFYEEAKNCYCILQSGESAIYANVILQKGVIK